MKLFKFIGRWILNLFKSKSVPTLFDLVPRLKDVNQAQLIHEILPGDIVECVFPFNPKQLQKTEPEHRTRPFIIVEVNDDHLIGYCGTSQSHRKPLANCFQLTNICYNVKKNGRIFINKAHKIPKDYLVKYKDSLYSEDLMELNHLLLKFNKPFIKYDLNVKEDFVLLVDNRYFYVIKVENDTIFTYPLSKTNGSDTVFFRHQKYLIDPANLKEFKVHDAFHCVGRLDIPYKANFTKVEPAKKQAPQNPHEKFHQVHYPFGQRFSIGPWDFIYLFSYKSYDFGFYLDDLDDNAQLIKICSLCDYPIQHPLPQDKLESACQQFIIFNNKYEWILNYLN